MFNVDRPDWQQLAACRGIDTNLFFPSNAQESAQAKAIIKPLCETCPVFEDCYAYAVSFPEKALQGIGNIPMETIEQHTYRSMEKRYGLRNLAVESEVLV
jgi:hypothetical protein